MRARTPVASAVLAGLCAVAAFGQGPGERPKWDQKVAVRKVKDLIALEEKGDFPWDDIAWQTDPGEASALARKEQKPIFVYFFLKRNVGPAAAPC